MRCKICDVSDVGLSLFRPDHSFSTNFIRDRHNPIDFICSSCFNDCGYDDLDDVLEEEFDEE